MAALPIAMLGATLLAGAAGLASLHAGESERDSIQLQSGQHVRVQSRVRLSEDGKKNHPDSCLVASEDGTVTKVDVAGRKATVRCNKNRRAAPEEIPADDLEVIDSGINAPGISIPGGYLTEGASVRMLDSSKRTNKGKALSSPFYNPVGTVMAIDKVAKQVVVLSQHLNNKSTAQEYYNIDDLEFVSGPSEAARRGAEAGLKLKIGSTVELTDDAKKKYVSGVVNRTFNKPPEKKLADPKWEKFGIVKSITVDPKYPKDMTKLIVIVRCVSKDSRKEVLEQKYDIADLKAIPAISVERAGIAVFGGMAEMDTKVKLRAERKSAVASKSLGRSAFGDMGTVSDLEPNDPNNLKVFVTCNGINPDEQTGDWYQPEDLELAEPEDTEGEAVFGGRVVVGSTVRVMQSARGKKCLGTPEFGDVGTVKGIDPSAPDNLRINVTCGRTDAKQSEWYDPRDLSLFFPMDESGSELEKAKVALAAAQKELSAWQLQSQTYRRSDDGRRDKKVLDDKVAAAQSEVDRLSGVGLDKTKANEMRNDSEEKLDEALKLKRELEAVRLKLSRDSTCEKPDRSKKYALATEAATLEWLENTFINPFDYKKLGTESLQYSSSYRVAFAELQTAVQALEKNSVDDDALKKYKALNQAKLALRVDLKKERSDTESFANLDDTLLDVAKKQNAFDLTASTPYKIALNTVDDKLKKLQEVTTQIESAAYSGDSPAEKLLKRVEDLEKKTNDDINGNATKLKTAVDNYEENFKKEQGFKLELDLNKRVYDDMVNKQKKKDYTITAQDNTDLAKQFKNVDDSRLKYLNAQKETLKARKEQALTSAKTTCSEITLESVKDMKEKIEKIISGKCGVLTTIDDLLDKVNDLISKRKRAFTMSQAVLDPKFGDPDNAIFDEPITSPEDRIKQIEEALAEINKLQPSDKDAWDKLQTLIGLCGKYDNDTTLENAKKIRKYSTPFPVNNCPKNPGPEPRSPEGMRPIKPDDPDAPPPQRVSAKPRSKSPSEYESETPPAPAPAPACPFKVGDIVHITNPAFNPSNRYVILTVTDCNSVQLVPEGESELTQKPMEFSISQIEAVAPATAGKRKWPFYGRHTTRRRGGGVEEANRVREAKRNLEAHPYDPRFQQKYDDARNAQLRSEGGVEKENPFNIEYTAPPQEPVGKVLTDLGLPVVPPTNPAFMPGTGSTRMLGKTVNQEDLDIRQRKAVADLEQNAQQLERENRENQQRKTLRASRPSRDIRGEISQQRQNVIAATTTDATEIAKKFKEKVAADAAEKTKQEAIAELKAIATKGAEDEEKKQALQKELEKKQSTKEAKQKSYDEAVAVQAEQKRRDEFAATGSEMIEASKQAQLKAQEDAILKEGGPSLLAEWRKQQQQKERDRALFASRLGSLTSDLKARKAREDAATTAAKQATIKEKVEVQAAARNKFYSDRRTYIRENPKWVKYDNDFKIWEEKKTAFDECDAKFQQEKEKWLLGRRLWLEALKKLAKQLSDYQILRLQSRGVGSSLMLDEARKLMIDADAQQQTVMDDKTDLQFTLASSSDADIAKAVGFYEAEVQKLKMCISKGKDDAIAEYDKDLAEIEKRKREITAKTFEVKAPEQNKGNQNNKFNSYTDINLLETKIQELERAEKILAAKNPQKGSEQYKQLSNIRNDLGQARQRKNILKSKPKTGGNRRMTMRRRRV